MPTSNQTGSRRPLRPYERLGAGAFGVGVWAALACGVAVAHADGPAADSTSPSVAGRSASATVNSGVARGPSRTHSARVARQTPAPSVGVPGSHPAAVATMANRVRRDLGSVERTTVPVGAVVASASPAVSGGAGLVGGTGGSSDSFGSGSNQFSLAFVTVGNAGNPGDPNSKEIYGSVPYVYRISTYEVSQNDIAMATAGGLEGVTAGAWGNTQPAAFMKWYEAAAFVNWLNSTSGYQPAYLLTYNGGTTNSSWVMSLWSSAQAWQNGGQNLYRNANAYYFLPNDNEWFKAAYQMNDGATADYWNYPTASNNAPNAVPSGTAAGTAVYGYDPTSSPAPVKSTGGLSAYGTMGQGGNVAEWMETSANGSNTDPSADRSFSGGAVNDQSQQLQADNRTSFNVNPAFESPYIGFRVASADIGVGSAGSSGKSRSPRGRPATKPRRS